MAAEGHFRVSPQVHRHLAIQRPADPQEMRQVSTTPGLALPFIEFPLPQTDVDSPSCPSLCPDSTGVEIREGQEMTVKISHPEHW